MQRVENLITIIRKMTGNTRYDSDSGIPQDVMVQNLNDAQDFLAKQVHNLKTKFFDITVEVPVVSGQRMYDYPEDCYVRDIDTIQWSDSNSGVYFKTLYKSYTKEKVTRQLGYPFGYLTRHDGIEFNPPVTSGIFYFTYGKTIPKLQKKSGQITVATVAGGNLTALEVATTEPYDETEINSDFFLCVCDKYGNVKARNIEYESCAGGIFTLNPFTLGSGDTVAVGDYILVGKNTTNVPEWPDACEPFLRKYAIYQVRYGDASKWSKEALDDMTTEFEMISGVFARPSSDMADIAITNLDYIGL
ncbi:MAG: hypothetical protein OM95_06885 [Bdellovibrio sp. ArHS]|uniref:phage adaptor protein n=1 Tax=Bdellovibrio sp. ArHS TaxID=1569284 RepID=UPI00058377C4|nr:hypothetical protein [Bdellovibrio sp. ArHS]KHD88835.1 MAG: hypothetical protein OM95_06885 [Bdellovibrio sp. ArHS]